MIHPARLIPFEDLLAGLEAERAKGFLYAREMPDGRRLYCYTKRCVYEQAWNQFTVLGRGLILDMMAQKVVATPFPKFFNAGEGGRDFPEQGFEAFEKVDGSLVIIHWHGSQWHAVTKGDFKSWQAVWTMEQLHQLDTNHLNRGTTYLAEMVHPENRIVVKYGVTELVMLGAFDGEGRELDYRTLQTVTEPLGWRVARRQAFASIADLVAHAEALPSSEEGFVVRFEDGTRLKVKGAEYRRIHALISRCTPLTVWEAIVAGDDLELLRQDLPEEYWGDFDQIREKLEARISGYMGNIAAAAALHAHRSDEELGKLLPTLDKDIARLIFPYRRGQFGDRQRKVMLNAVRPDGNELDGYIPSYALKRVADEAA